MPSNIIADAKRKAKQLENFDYRKNKDEDQYGKVGDYANEETVSAMEFLHKLRKLPLDKMSREDVETSITPLLKQYGFTGVAM